MVSETRVRVAWWNQFGAGWQRSHSSHSSHSPSRPASPSTAARAVSSLVCPYTSPVIAIDECTEQIGDRLDMHTGFEPIHCRRMPQRVHAHTFDTGHLGCGLDHAEQVARVDRAAQLGGEHQTAVAPLVAAREADCTRRRAPARR
jgi:hypothetical protein